MQREMIRLGWGLDEHSFRLYFAGSFIPDGPSDLWTDFAELLRRTTSAENALRIFDACADMDVAASATQLDLPTLIMHGRDELRIPFDEAREYASLIRGSRLVPLDTRNHLIRPDEPAWEHMLGELDSFRWAGLTVARSCSPPGMYGIRGDPAIDPSQLRPARHTSHPGRLRSARLLGPNAREGGQV
jgi:hypothetical protein